MNCNAMQKHIEFTFNFCQGAKVVMACKDMQKCMEAKYEIIDETWNKNVECIKCDLSSLESIKEFVNTFKSSNKLLHVLVNNAGLNLPR